eukprot:Pompholyxophrys_punicea_v1_NODE_93_length_3578_cov_92.823162.p2 type:complete len:144 gc:universal NODE_93_length_3578_cov_92.823162:1687-1256(-)
MANDQAHEQQNALFKGDGGAVGLTENPVALRRWLLAGPDLSRLITEFEEGLVSEPTSSSTDSDHHECGKSTQVTFHKQVKSLKKVILEMGNPFQLEDSELVTLDNQNVVDDCVLQSYRNLRFIGTANSCRMCCYSANVPLTNQ